MPPARKKLLKIICPIQCVRSVGTRLGVEKDEYFMTQKKSQFRHYLLIFNILIVWLYIKRWVNLYLLSRNVFVRFLCNFDNVKNSQCIKFKRLVLIWARNKVWGVTLEVQIFLMREKYHAQITRNSFLSKIRETRKY